MAEKKLIDITLLGKYDAKIKNVYITGKESTINAKIGTIPTGYADLVAFINGKITEVNGAADSLEARVAANETAIGKAATDTAAATGLYLYTDNAAKAAVDKVVAGASTSFDTLKEIADWIASDTTGAAKMANDIAALKGTSSDTSASVSIVGAKKYADEQVAGKNVTAAGESGDAALVSASAANNKVTVASTAKLQAAVTRAEAAVLSVTEGASTENYVTLTVTDGDNAKIAIDDSALAAKIGVAGVSATGMYADMQGATNMTVKDMEDKVGTVPAKVGTATTSTVIAYTDAKSAADVKALQGATTSTVKAVEDKLNELTLAAESDINGLFA